MVTLRRSVRESAQKKKPVVKQEEEEEEEDEGQDEPLWSEDESSLEDDEDDFDSERDEWKPEKQKKSSARGVARVKHEEDDGDEDDDEEDEDDDENEDEDEDEMLSELGGVNVTKRKRKGAKRAAGPTATKKSKAGIEGEGGEEELQEAEAEDAYAAQLEAAVEAEEQEEAREEAKRLWDEARARKAARDNPKDKLAEPSSSKPSDPTHAAIAEKRSLDAWLGVDAPTWPTTTPEAMINDRDSLFVGYVYALESSSASQLSRLLSHLARTVHPQSIPTERLPPAVRHLAATRRGSTHDMHAWRCLALKRGRNGLGGPDDFGLEDGQEDDGEKHGGREIARAIKELGATDVLVIVSRWYGGTMLGPVRFQHIYQCAHAALSRYLLDEAMKPMREQLKSLDTAIADLRIRLNVSSSQQTSSPMTNTSPPVYADLDPEKATRLINARRKTIELLEKRLQAAAK